MVTSQRSLRGAWSRSLYTGPFHGQMFTRAGMPSQGNLHCARRCRALGEQLGAMRSRCDCAALGAAAGQACSRGGHDLVVASTPQALDGPHHATNVPSARALARPRPSRTSATLASSKGLPQVPVARALTPPPAPNACAPAPPASIRTSQRSFDACLRPPHPRRLRWTSCSSAWGSRPRRSRRSSPRGRGPKTSRGSEKGAVVPDLGRSRGAANPILAKTAGDLKSRCEVVYGPKKVSFQGLASRLSVIWSAWEVASYVGLLFPPRHGP